MLKGGYHCCAARSLVFGRFAVDAEYTGEPLLGSGYVETVSVSVPVN